MFKDSSKLTLVRKLPDGAIFKGKALSDSMVPLIRKGDVLEIKKDPFHLLKAGDVIAFCQDNGEKFYVHRVIKTDLENKRLKTKGDNLERVDEPVDIKQYVGKAIFAKTSGDSIPLVGWRSRLFGWSLSQKLPEIPELSYLEKIVKKLLKYILFFPNKKLK